MSELDIKRKTEEYLCAKLRPLVPGHIFMPSGGFAGDKLKDSIIEPPFTVVVVGGVELMKHSELTWSGDCAIQVIHHADEVGSDEHSRVLNEVVTAVANLQSDVSGAPDFILHGIDIQGTSTARHQQTDLHADIISCRVGMSG